jgi:hypothetical protein
MCPEFGGKAKLCRADVSYVPITYPDHNSLRSVYLAKYAEAETDAEISEE